MKLLFKSIKESDRMVKMLMPSLLGLSLCIVCLTGTTWSWFTDNVTATMQSVKAANYDIIVDIQGGEKLEDGKYNLSQKTEGEGYQITVKANGSASTGFFRVSGPDGFLPLFSTQIAPGEVITFTFYPAATGEYYFESAWGTYSGENTIKNNDIIGTPAQSQMNIADTEELEDTEKSNDVSDSTPALGPNEEENLDKEVIGDSDEELDDITSTVQPTEDPDDTEKTFPPHLSNGDSVSEDSVEQPTNETEEETSGNTEQNQE